VACLEHRLIAASSRGKNLMFIELSYPIGPGTTVMESALKPPEVRPRSRMGEGRHSNTSYIGMFAHTGTHIDAPWHFNDTGRRIMDFGIGDFVFSKVLLVDIPAEAWQPVPLDALKPFESRLAACDALLIRSGFAAFRRSDPDQYVEATPGLSVETARFLAGFPGLRCIGVDFISVENVKKGREIGFPVHHALLDRTEPIILLEDADLAAAADRTIIRLYLFPLRMEGLEASPVTAVAEV
jgi:kynurenine formamidase